MPGLAFGSPMLALAACAAVLLPILIHLLLRRRRLPVEWAAMELLREALRRIERRRRVERLLLLAVRCALIAAAGLAIAAPFIGESAEGSRSGRTLVVVVDDSAASNESLGDRTAFAASVDSARASVESLRDGDRVAVVAASRASSVAREAASLDRAGALRMLSSMSPTELPCDLPGALAAAAAIASQPESEGHVREVLLASAFRAGSVGAMAPLPTLGDGLRIRATAPPEAIGPNLRLASVEPERIAGGGSVSSVQVRVARDRGDSLVRTAVRAHGPSLTAPVERTVELQPGERERTVSIAFTERSAAQGAQSRRAVTATVGADAQPVDDSRGVALAADARIRAVIVDRRSFDAGSGIDRLSPGEWIARALAPSDPAPIEAVFVDPAAFDARTAAAADAVIVVQPQQLTEPQWSLLSSFVTQGGLAAFMPAARERAQPWTAAFVRTFGAPWTFSLEAVDSDAGVALAEEQPSAAMLGAVSGELRQLAPSVEAFRVLRVDAGADRGATELAFRDGTPFLLALRPAGARGTVCVLSVAMDLAWTTLPLKPFMVPLWQELVAEGRRRATAAEQVPVGSVPVVDRAGVVELRAIAADGSPLDGVRPIAVGAGGRAGAAIERSGLYQMVDSAGAVQGVLAAWVDPASASVEPIEPDRIRGWMSAAGPFAWDGDAGAVTDAPGTEAGAASVASTVGVSLAPWFLGAALLLALLESVLARRFSHAFRVSTARGGGAVRLATGAGR